MVMIFTLLPMNAFAADIVASGTCGDNLTWTLDSEGTLTISGTGAMYNYYNWNNLFGSKTPWYNKLGKIKTAVVENGVTSIGDYAFDGCSSLTSVTIGSGVTTIGNCAFYNCSSLTSVTIPDSVTSIGDYAFYNCSSLTSVTIPDSVTSIGDYAFCGCSSLTNVTIGNGVTTIGNYAFESCSSLTSINVDNNNEYYSSSGGVLFVKNQTILIYYPAGKTESNYTIPDSVTSIGGGAFYKCSSLTNVTIPDSVTSIGDWAFSGCSNLTSVTIGNGVTTIGSSAFSGCSNLTSVTIGNGVTTIGSSAFFGCSSLTSVTIGSGVTSIGEDAFYKCSNLTSVTIGNGVTTIGSSAFSGCSSLTSVTIPDSVTSIGDWSFSGCSNLTSVTIGNGVTTIGDYAFSDCSLIKDVYYNGDITSWLGILFQNYASNPCSNGAMLYFNGELVTDLTIPDSVTTIGYSAFYSCSNLTSVTIGNGVTSIGDQAFRDCTSLTDVYYSGSEEQWKAISISVYNDCLLNARIHYNWGTAIFHINSITPNHKAVGINEKFTIEFNKNVELGTGNIHVNIQDGKTDSITQEYYIIPVSLLEVSGNLVTVDISVLNLPEGSYYVTIPAGAFVSCDGDKFFGMKNKIDWEFAVDYDYDTEVPLKYAQKGHLFWKTDDKTKPGIPNGSDSDYAAVLYKWAKANGIDNLTEQQALKMLDEPMYLPATDMNGSTVLLNDKSTTVRQALEDILFFENLKPFAVNLDNDLSKIERFNQTGELKINALHQETDLYENVLGWYPQINSYLDSRNSKSNIFYSAIAPVAYNGLIMATDSAGIPGYSFVKPVIEADIQTAMLSESLQGLEQYSNYTDFKNASKDVGTILKSGKAIYKAVAGEGSAKSFINLGANMLQTYFADSGNSTLNEISKSWSTADSVISATQLCISLGSSIGYFPLVVDLYNKGFERISNTVGACYFIGDYYVYDKYPEIYDSIYDDNTCMPEFDLMKYMDFAQAAENDPILYNWFEFLGKVTEGAMRDECRQLRYDLVNYILLLQYAREYDSDNTKSALVKYLSAECNKGKTTQFYTSCPVKVEVYDKNTNELVASLSSIDESIEENPYCSMYLMGENNETKCFVLSSDEYYAKIIPYDDGTMDIAIISEDENGEASGKTFSNVQLTENKEFTLDLNDMNSGLETEDGSTIDKESTVPVSTVEISGVSEIAVGDSIQLTANAQPVIASDRNITWSSSDESVATVSNTGVVKAVSQGEAVIYAEASNGVKGEFAVSVFVKATELSLSIKNLSMVTGESYTLSAAISESATHEVSWKSENISKVAVDSSGNIYAKAAGSSLVTATIDGIEADVFVSVSDYPLDTVLYQLDGDGNALKLELSNNSCIEDLDEQGYIALYESGKVVEVFDVDINLAAGEKLTKIVLIPDFKEEKTYSAVFVPMGEKLLNQPSSELVFINGDSASEGTTEAATNELSGCQLASVTVSETTVGNMYTLFVINDESGNPSSENISYIERKQASEGQLEFLFGLDHLPNDGTHHAYLQLPDGTTTEMEIVRPNANQHIYTSAVTAPTCTAQGYTTYTCACGDSYIDSYVDALGHDFGAWKQTKAPTCTEKGTETRYCSRCDATETREVNALGHDYKDGVCTVCGATEEVVASGTCGENLTWRLDSEGTLTISGTGKMNNFPVGFGENTAPWGSNASQIKTVNLLQGVESIGESAFFACTSLTSVTIPSSVTSIGYAAFKFCFNLSNVSISNGVTSIGNDAFYGCESLNSVTIPNSVTSIGYAAFSYCSGLTSVTIPSSVTRISGETFSYCSSLTSISIPNSVTSIGDYAFYNCENLTDVYYGGSEEQWNEISIDILNENLTEANIHFKTDTPISNPFTDVSESSVYYDAILWAYYHEPQQITGGYTATEFRPGNPCTRGQVVTFLWRAAGCPEPTGDTSMFKDASSIAAPYQKAVAWAVEKGITTGFADGTFRPNDSVTRAQFVTFLWRYEGKPATSGSIAGFTDASSISGPYQQAVAWAVEKGITTGYNDGSFRPNATCTRWAVVLFMYRDME